MHIIEERIKRGDFDLKAAIRPFEEGDLVYLLDTSTMKGKCRELSPSWKGSGIILKKLPPYLYRVKTKTAVMVTMCGRYLVGGHHHGPVCMPVMYGGDID